MSGPLACLLAAPLALACTLDRVSLPPSSGSDGAADGAPSDARGGAVDAGPADGPPRDGPPPSVDGPPPSVDAPLPSPDGPVPLVDTAPLPDTGPGLPVDVPADVPVGCPAPMKTCAGACIGPTACCPADGCCAHADCGLCQKCTAGSCVPQTANEDLKNECADGACRTGTCNGAGACGITPDGQNGPSCAGECLRCSAGACQERMGVCSTGQMCENGRCPPRPPVAIRINVNGPAHGSFVADPGVGGVCGPSAFQVDRPINGTEDDPLYVREMFGNPLTCAVGAGQLPPGPYQVALHLAEIFWGPTCPGGGGAGSRLFDIEIEGRVVASRVDLFSEVGCAASTDGSGRPVIKRFMATITDGTLNLRFPAHADNGKISAIELLSAW